MACESDPALASVKSLASSLPAVLAWHSLTRSLLGVSARCHRDLVGYACTKLMEWPAGKTHQWMPERARTPGAGGPPPLPGGEPLPNGDGPVIPVQAGARRTSGASPPAVARGRETAMSLGTVSPRRSLSASGNDELEDLRTVDGACRR